MKTDIPEEIPLGNDVITRSNYKLFTRVEITDPLIINFAGGKGKRKKTFGSIKKKINKDKGVYAFVDEFEIIESTNHQMGAIDLSDSAKSDPHKVISKLLKGTKIEYLQVEQMFEVV